MRLDERSSAQDPGTFEPFRSILWQAAYPCGMLAIYWILHNVAGLNDKQLDWAFYAVLCASLPISYFVFKHQPTTRFSLWLGGVGFCGALLWLAVHAVFNKGNGLPIAGGLFFGGVCAWRAFRYEYPCRYAFAQVSLCAITSFVLLHLSGKLAWWTDLSSLSRHNRLLIPVLLAVSGLFWRYMSPVPIPPSTRTSRNGLILYWPVVVLIFSESFRTFGLFEVDTGCMHHWTCYVGPVDLVRHGGKLLWDVPSQYGFLSILAAAVLPIKSAWESVYVLAGTAQFVMGWVLFHHFCGRRSWQDVASSAILVVVGVFVIPGLMLTGSLVFPSVSALRFIWVVLMIVCLFRLATVQERRRQLHVHVLNALWLAGFLWSFESAFYCSVTLGSYLVAEYFCQVRGSRGYFSELKLLLEPCLMFAIAIVGIWLFYRFQFGHGPDWRGFFEHALAFQGGFGSLPIVLTGGLLYILGVVALLLRFCRLSGLSSVGNSIFGMACATVAVFSYFAGRSHENNILNIFPIPLAALVFAGRLMKDRDSSVLRALAVSLMSPVILLGVGNKVLFAHLRDTWFHQQHHVDSLIPALPSPIVQLLGKMPLNKATSVVLADFQGFACLPHSLPANLDGLVTQELWLPLRPLAVLVPLSPERITVYFDRWHENHTTSGWIIYGSFEKPYIDPILKALERSCQLEQEVRSDNYVARYYVPIPSVRQPQKP